MKERVMEEQSEEEDLRFKLIDLPFKEQVNILTNFLVSFHTATWTYRDLKPFFDKMAAFSYSRTNSNGDEEYEEWNQQQTLLNLNK